MCLDSVVMAPPCQRRYHSRLNKADRRPISAEVYRPASITSLQGRGLMGGKGNLMATNVTPAQGTSDTGVEKVRAWSGLIAVVAGDLAIAVAAVLGITHFTTSGTSSSQAVPQIVAILSGAFTAISTMTTAYFGIKAIS